VQTSVAPKKKKERKRVKKKGTEDNRDGSKTRFCKVTLLRALEGRLLL
jgi:hypothetical protein